MRSIKTLILLVCTMLGLATMSCHDDLSTLNVKELPGVMIDTTGVSKLSVYQFNQLVVEPKLEVTGVSGDNLSYEWRINPQPGDTLFQVIGNEKNLDYEVRFKPNIAGQHHLLYYTVTDHTTGLEYIMSWPVVVKNNIGEGLVIAETSDGVNSDLSHIMYAGVTPDFSGESVKHHVYSAINGTTINGIVKQMRFTTILRVDVLLGITENSIFKINTLDYTLGGKNNDLFYRNSSSYTPQALGGVVQGDIYIGNGKLTGTYLGITSKFGLPFDFLYTVPDHVAINGTSNPPVAINFYDEVNEHFVYLPSVSSFGDKKMYPAPSAPTDAPFNPASLPNKINLAAGVSTEGDFIHLLQDKTTGATGLYVLNGGKVNYPNPVIAPAPKAYYDLTDAPNIKNATQFVLLDNQKVMYYATSNKIYAVLYSTPIPVFEERYTVPAGEEITTLQVYQQANYPYTSGPFLATNNKQLIMSTYNGTEGKVYILPMVNTGIGNIDVANIKTFSGFDKITAIATQK